MSISKNHIYLLLALAIAANSCINSRNQSGTGERKNTIAQIELVTGPLPSLKNLPPFNVQVSDSIQTETYKRYTIRFTVASGEELSALLYKPLGYKQHEKTAAMLVLHSTDATGKMVLSGNSPKPNRAYGVELAERGYVVIAPDYPGFGDLRNYDFENDPYASGTMKGIFHHIRCVDFLQSLPYVDGRKIGVLGHSLGGHNAIFAAAFDERLKVTVSSCGWTLFDFYNAGAEVTRAHGGRLGPWAQDKYMPRIRTIYNLDPALIPFDFDDAIALIAPRAFFTNSPLRDVNFNIEGVKKGMNRIENIYKKMKAENHLRVVYPDTGHDFPKEARLQAYGFIDSILGHVPRRHELHR